MIHSVQSPIKHVKNFFKIYIYKRFLVKKIKLINESDSVSWLSHVWFFVTPWTVAHQSPWNSPGKNTGVGCHVLLQGLFLTQGSNPSLQHWRQILYCLSHQESPELCIPDSNTEPLSCYQSMIHRPGPAASTPGSLSEIRSLGWQDTWWIRVCTELETLVICMHSGFRNILI